MNIDHAREILTAVVHHRGDIDNRFRNESYRDLLGRTFTLIGLPEGNFGEAKSRIILNRAYRAARHRGFYADPIDPAEAARAVLQTASRTGR